MNKIQIAKQQVRQYWQSLDQKICFNQEKVLQAFKQAKVGSHCFADSSGYGYGDIGRDTLEQVYALVFKTKAALVRPQIVSGTHAISVCLSILNAGSRLISISGSPYDTLQQVIGTKGSASNSLIKRGIDYQEISLTDQGKLDYKTIKKSVSNNTDMVMLQRSRGYNWRPSITISEIKQAFEIVKSINPDCVCFVDNCYGEFVETLEPSEVGANLTAGSLIKNPGGTIAPSGGYIVGDRQLVNQCGEILTAPGLGTDIGPTFNVTKQLLQGFFYAPHIVGQALRGAILAAQVFDSLGYQVSPLPDEPRTDIIQAIELKTKEKLLAFCHGIQKSSPIDSQFVPVPDQMPGYDDQIVMAAGTFVQGASIELSADAPLRDPYIVFLQGGIGIEHIEIALSAVLQELSLFSHTL